MRQWGWITAAMALLLACAIRQAAAFEPPAYVLLGPEGRAIARILLPPGNPCPVLDVDGRPLPMQVRVGPETQPEDVARSAPFPVTTCELDLPATARRVQLGGKPLPRPSPVVQRIVVLGDTGCRMKWPASFQDCDDASRWPLARIAASAAVDRPDLVIHVGDYHYRESRCRAAGCADSPYGYGWEAWHTDFFEPARPLLQAAPWVMVRGNHEACARAGQGWFRFLDARRYDPAHACRGEAPYEEDFTEPFAVPLASGPQLIVFDSSGASERNDAPNVAATARYVRRFSEAAGLAAQAPSSWLVLHHPVLGYGYRPLAGYVRDAGVLTEALSQLRFPDFLPAGIQMVLQGHIHTFELNQFQGNYPVSLLAGFGGSTLEDEFPPTVPAQLHVVPGVTLAQTFSTQQFGYVLLEREENRWTLYEKDTEGRVRRRCVLDLQHPPYGVTCAP